MSERILLKLICYSKDITLEIVKNWCLNVCKCFTPEDMSGHYISNLKHRRYNEKKFYDGLEKELDRYKTSLSLSDEKNSFSIIKNARASETVLSLIIDKSVALIDFDSMIDSFMLQCGIVAFKCSLDDDFWQNAECLSYYISKNKSLDGIKTKMREFGLKEEIVDVEYNPGHSHRPQGIWFGSCHKMWFGKAYYQYIAKEKLLKFDNCYENKELENDVIRITLYEDIWAYDKEENRKIQWDFRKKVGVDDVAHVLEKMKKQSSHGAEIEILTTNLPKGESRVIRYYLDDEDNFIPKEKASKVRTYGFSEKGQVLSFNEELLTRRKSLILTKWCTLWKLLTGRD